MGQQTFTPTSGSTHGTFRTIFNANATDAETRISGLENFTGSHQHVVTDIDSAVAPSGYVITADGSGNATWEESQGGGGGGGGGNFSLVTVTTPTYTQIPQHTHHNYDDDAAFTGGGSGSGSGGAGPLYVDLLDPTLHEGCCGVTVHKKVGSTADVVLVPPSGCTIDGITGDGDTVGLHLTSQWEAVSIYSDGVSGYYIQ